MPASALQLTKLRRGRTRQEVRLRGVIAYFFSIEVAQFSLRASMEKNISSARRGLITLGVLPMGPDGIFPRPA